MGLWTCEVGLEASTFVEMAKFIRGAPFGVGVGEGLQPEWNPVFVCELHWCVEVESLHFFLLHSLRLRRRRGGRRCCCHIRARSGE